MTKFDSRIIKVVDEKIKELIPLWLDSGKRDDDVYGLLKRITEALPLLQDIKTEIKEAESRDYPPMSPKDKKKEDKPKKANEPLDRNPEGSSNYPVPIDPLPDDRGPSDHSLVPAIIDAVESGDPSDVIMQMLLGYDPNDKQAFKDYLDDQIDSLTDWFADQANNSLDAAKGLSWVVQKVTGALANMLKVLRSEADKRRIRDTYVNTLSIISGQSKDRKTIERVEESVNDVFKALKDCCLAMQTSLAIIQSKIGTGFRIPNIGTETPKRGFPSLPFGWTW